MVSPACARSGGKTTKTDKGEWIVRHVILALLAMTGLACSEKASPLVGETFV